MRAIDIKLTRYPWILRVIFKVFLFLFGRGDGGKGRGLTTQVVYGLDAYIIGLFKATELLALDRKKQGAKHIGDCFEEYMQQWRGDAGQRITADNGRDRQAFDREHGFEWRSPIVRAGVEYPFLNILFLDNSFRGACL